MLTKKEKAVYLSREKVFKKKGMEGNPLVGKLVHVDWDLWEHGFSGLKSKDEVSSKDREWADESTFVVTGVNHSGLGSTVALDGKYEMSMFKVYDQETGDYLARLDGESSLKKGPLFR